MRGSVSLARLHDRAIFSSGYRTPIGLQPCKRGVALKDIFKVMVALINFVVQHLQSKTPGARASAVCDRQQLL